MLRARGGGLAVKSLLASLALLASLLVAAAPAHAQEGDKGADPLGLCERDPGTYYSVWSKQDKRFHVGMHYKGGPGGTVTATTQYSLSVSATVNMSTSVSVSAVVASANGTFGISATTGSSISQTWSHTWSVSPGRYGNVQWVNWGWSMNVRKDVIGSSCNKSSWTGTASLPSVSSWGYYYWETSY